MTAARTRRGSSSLPPGLAAQVITHGIYQIPLPPGSGTGLSKPLKMLSAS
jgi:hypothetical protein